jgi:predicted outer membrane repeat protein
MGEFMYLRKLFALVLLISAFALANSTYGRTINVPTQATTIQAGIDSASAGDTVMVASGTYTGTGNINVSFNGKAIVVRSQSGAQYTIIDCSPAGNRAFTFDQGETRSSKLIGFTIRNGDVQHRWVAGLPDKMGGAVKIKASPSIEDCIMDNCKAENGGGIAILTSAASPEIIQCTFSNDTASNYNGGGIYYGAGHDLILQYCIFTANYASGSGGGIFAGGSTCAIEYSEFSLNSCYDNGGAIYSGTNTTVNNCTLVKNEAMFGDAILVAAGTELTIERSIVAFNTGSTGAVRSNSGSTITFECDDFWDNHHGHITGTYDSTAVDSNSIFKNPLFCDAPNGNYYISTHSPCDEDSSRCDLLIGRWDNNCDYCCWLGGDANNDDKVNVADVTFLQNCIYNNGPCPPCPDCGDPNNNCVRNIQDITYLINYLYRGGPAPVCGCLGH